MSGDVESEKVFCKFCGAEIKQDAQFCKKCGKSFNEEDNFISRINGKINILSVFIGLIVSVIVLLIGAGFFGSIIISKTMDVMLYLFLIFFAMLFLGGLTTGILGSPNIQEGFINGGFLSLVAFIILGFTLGLCLFITIGITSTIANALSSIGTSTASSNVSSPSINTTGLIYIIEGILALITCFFGGIGGGALGAWIKGGIK